MIGPDISNLAINQSTGQPNVAESHSTSVGKIREVDIKSGFAKNAVEPYNLLAIGAYPNIQVDPATNRLYTGDDVSDSIFVADLSARTISLRHNWPSSNDMPAENEHPVLSLSIPKQSGRTR